MSNQDPVSGYLERRGCSKEVVAAGLDGLVQKWEGVVEAVANTYQLTLDDYLNDMDVRDLLDNALHHAGAEERVRASALVDALDIRFRSLTRECPCLWGKEAEREESYNRKKHWWYYRNPRKPGSALDSDLVQNDLV